MQSPCAIDLQKVVTKHLMGTASASECLYLDEKRNTKIHVIPRDEGQAAFTEALFWNIAGTLLLHLSQWVCFLPDELGHCR